MIASRTKRPRGVVAVLTLLLVLPLSACSDETTGSTDESPDAGPTPTPDVPDEREPTPIEELEVDTGVSDDGPTAGQKVQVVCTVQGLAPDQEEPATHWEIWKSPPDMAHQPELLEDDKVRFLTAGEYVVRCIIDETGWIDPTPVKLKVHAGVATSVETTVEPEEIQAGTIAQVDCDGVDEWDNPIVDDWEIVVSPGGSDPGIEGGVVAAHEQVKGLNVGTYHVACQQKSGEADDTPATVTVTEGQPYRLVTTLGDEAIVACDVDDPEAPPCQGDYVTAVNCHAEDKWGNVVQDFPMNLDLPTKLTLQGFQVTGFTSGKYSIRCVPAAMDWNLFSLDHANLEILPDTPVSMDLALQPPKPFFGTYEKFGVVALAYDRYDNPIPDAPIEPIVVAPAGADYKEMVGNKLLFREEGHFVLTVTLADHPDIWGEIDVAIDGAPPTVQVLSPERGSTVRNPKPSVTVEGTADDSVTSVKEVRVNGKAATVYEDGTWSTILIPKWGLNVLEVEAEDAGGDVTSVTTSFYFAEQYYEMEPDVEYVPDAIKTWLDDEFIDDGDHNPTHPNDLATLMEGAIGAFDMNSALPDKVKVSGDYDLKMKGFSMNPPSLYLDPFDGGLNIDITIKNVKIKMELEGECKVLGIDLCPDFGGSAKVGVMELNADLLAEAVKGNMEMGLANPKVELKALDIDIDGILGWLFDWLIDFLVDIFTDSIADAFEDQMGDLLADTLSEVVNALAISQTFEMESPMPGVIGDLSFTLDSNIWSLSFTEDGGRLGLAARLDTTKKIPHDVHGSIARGTCVKGYPLTYLLPGQTAFEAALYDDFINLALTSIWYQGVLDIFLDQDTIAELMGDGGDEAMPIPVDELSLSVDFLLPPILNGCDPAGLMKLQVGDAFLDIDMVSPFFEGGKGDIGVYLSMQATVELVVTETDEGPAVGILFHGIDEIWYQWEYVPELFEDTEILEDLIEDELLGPALEDLGNEPLGNIVVPELDLGELTPLFNEGTIIDPAVEDLTRENGHSLLQGYLE
ncbi:MAG: hypothetical protein ACQEXJ_01190 [Myxococcota bacterium]